MISKEEVKHIAKLARLGLTPKEIEKMQKDLSLVLDYFNLLKDIDVSKVEPTSHSISRLGNFFREDKAVKKSPEDVQKLLEAAPEKEGRYVRVKEIL
jgi:aspartyl-tRNA(Asn)/glutamyl-tRNA(Gln) amidotransferase subunit C